MAAERLALGSLATDPLVRLQMAGINPEVRRYKHLLNIDNNLVLQVSAHTHTHLHMHPDAAAAAALMFSQQHPGFPGRGAVSTAPPPLLPL